MITVRASVAGDHPSLMALERTALQHGSVVFFHEYDPDIEAFLSLQGFKHMVWIAEHGGEVVGCVAESQRRAVIDGKERSVYYLGGLRVAPQASAMTGFTLMTRARQSLEDSRCGLGLALVLSGNTPALEFVESFTRRRNEILRAGEVVTSVIPPLPIYRCSGKYNLRTAKVGNIPEIAQLLAVSHARHYCAPPFSEDWLRGTLAHTPGFSIDDVRVAERGGRIVATAAFWDQRAVRRLCLAGLDGPGRAKARLWSALARLSGGLGPDTKGGALRVTYLRFPAAEQGHGNALRDLLRKELCDRRLRRRYAAVFAGFHEQDPLRSSLKGVWRFTVRSTVVLTIPKIDPMLTPGDYAPSRPFYIDVSLV